jgi:hypothetical protein
MMIPLASPAPDDLWMTSVRHLLRIFVLTSGPHPPEFRKRNRQPPGRWPVQPLRMFVYDPEGVEKDREKGLDTSWFDNQILYKI